jgi:hypothetical protein
LYPDRAGAHPRHVAAIGTGNSSCDTCHPNPGGARPGSTDVAHSDNVTPFNIVDVHQDGRTPVTATYFKTIAGITDTGGSYSNATDVCSNVACHGGTGSSTPTWYSSDNEPPVWTGGMNISATDCVVGGTLQVQWRRATDAKPSDPVRYDLYMSTTGNAAAVYGGTAVLHDLLDNVATLTGLVNGTNYFFGVRAKDSSSTPNQTTDNTISAARAPTGYGNSCGTGTNTTYNASWGAIAPAVFDGTQNPTVSGTQLAWSATNFGRQPASTTAPGTAYSYNVRLPDTAWHMIGRFYITPEFATEACIGPSLTSGAIGLRTLNANDNVQLFLVSYNPTTGDNVVLDNGAILAGSTTQVERTYTMPLTGAKRVSAGNRLVLEVRGKAAAANDNIAIYFGTSTSPNRTRFTVPVYSFPVDNTPPTWTGGNSGILATDNLIGGAIWVRWLNAATDTTKPVTYDLYRSNDNTALWSSPYMTDLAVRSVLDTGLSNGLRYYYGVRAKDGVLPTHNQTTNTDNASAIPTGAGLGCSSCHGFPPTTDNTNKGSHAKHAPAGSEATVCNNCHPGASAYANNHQDGVGQLGFSGTAYNAIYGNPTATTLRYNNGTQDFYVDSNGYGELTGVAGDGIDNGTCSLTVCHGSKTQTWGGTLNGGCLDCHSRAIPPDIPDNTAAVFMTSTRKHVNSVKDSDCKVCHHDSQPMVNSNNTIYLRNTDTGAALMYKQDNSASMRSVANTFCLSCHDANGASYTADGFVAIPTRPFSDCAVVPNIAQFWVSTTANSHNYPRPTDNANTVPVRVKARSPHGFPGTNVLKNDAQTKYTNANPVSCLECHPSHGGNILAPRKSRGGPLTDGRMDNAMIEVAEPQLCWNCHDAAGVQDYWGDTTTGGHWSGTLKNAFAYKQRNIASFHSVNDNTQGIACSICHNPHGASNWTTPTSYWSPMLRGTWMTSPYIEDRTGWLSTATNTTVANMSKLTQSRFGPRGSSDNAYNYPATIGHGYPNSTGTGQDGYYIDENTFGVSGAITQAWQDNLVKSRHITETDTSFAGLCAICHTDATWTGTGGLTSMRGYLVSGLTTPTQGRTGWGAAIHHTVKGWANTTTSLTKDVVNPTNNPDMRGYNWSGTCTCMAYDTGCSAGWAPWRGYNWEGIPTGRNQMVDNATANTKAVHQFTCSKCHTPHASDLVKLMVTNCLDVGASTTARKAHGTAPAWNYPTIGGPAIGANNQAVAMLCHNRGKTNTASDNGWNKVTGW